MPQMEMIIPATGFIMRSKRFKIYKGLKHCLGQDLLLPDIWKLLGNQTPLSLWWNRVRTMWWDTVDGIPEFFTILATQWMIVAFQLRTFQDESWMWGQEILHNMAWLSSTMTTSSFSDVSRTFYFHNGHHIVLMFIVDLYQFNKHLLTSFWYDSIWCWTERLVYRETFAWHF